MAASVAPPAAAMISSTSSPPPPPPWSGLLLPDLLSEILTHLRPADVACFRVVCRAWHSAARQHGRQHQQQQLPWIVLPNGSFGTISGDFFRRVPGLPHNVTCLGATDSWLVLDRTDNVFRRTNCDFLEPRHEVRHKHSYLLYNPFSGRTVLLPVLDSVVGDVPETFEIRKVLMRRRSASRGPDDDDLVVVTTNSRNYTIIICRPGLGKKGRFVIPYIGVWDVAFFGDALYGITEDEDLVVFELAKNDDGEPIVSGLKRVISHPLADGEEDQLSWINAIVSGLKRVISHLLADGEEDRLSWTDEHYNISMDDKFLDGDDEVTVVGDDDDVRLLGDGTVLGRDVVTTRRLVESSCELLMVRHQERRPRLYMPAYTRKMDIFKADMEAGRWVPVTATALAQGEALFLSRSASRVTRAYGDIKDGFVYSVHTNDAFDTRSGTRRTVSLPRQRKQAAREFLTWFFPPRLVL